MKPLDFAAGAAAQPSGDAQSSQRDPELICSAKRCGRTASTALLWNNPGIHTPERRKVWLACPEHVDYLSEFLSLRGFLKLTVPVAEIPEGVG